MINKKRIFWWILIFLWSIPELIYGLFSSKKVSDDNLSNIAKHLFKKVGL